MGCFSCFGEDDEELKKGDRKGKDGKNSNKSSIQIDEDNSAIEERTVSQKGATDSNVIQVEGSGLVDIVNKAFSFSDLAAATENFSEDNLLGEGGFGRVYKGYLDCIDQVVAVKKLDRSGLQGNREFLMEVIMLSLLHHPHLVNLLGYCADGDQRLLVYEYMPLGSLEDHLHDILPDKEPLDWSTRIKIATGAAKGVEYLHDKFNPPVIYRDMKPSNILLGEGYFPKISDFGLAKLGPAGDDTHVSTRVMGTYGYCAPEYAMTGKLTPKSDVYSFGVVFLEILTGRRAIDYSRPSGEQNLVAWARPLFKDRRNFPRMADPLLQGRYPLKGLYQALAIAAMCIHEQASARPQMRDVVKSLSYLASQTCDPNAVASVNTPHRRTQGHQKNRSIYSDKGDATPQNHHEPDVYVKGSKTKLNKDENNGSGFCGDSERKQVSRDNSVHVEKNDSPRKSQLLDPSRATTELTGYSK